MHVNSEVYSAFTDRHLPAGAASVVPESDQQVTVPQAVLHLYWPEPPAGWSSAWQLFHYAFPQPAVTAAMLRIFMNMQISTITS